jgi:hypothetical protein
MRRFFLCLWVGALGMGMWAGCGYSTRAYVSNTGYKTVYVAPFVNKVDTTSESSEGRGFKTYYPLLENRITNAIVDRFIRDGNLKATKEQEADLVLKGELVGYRRESLRNATDDTPEEYRVTIFVNMALEDKKSGKKWEKNNFAGETTYYTTGQYAKSETQAVEGGVEDLARRVVESIIDVW